ncbi:glycosyltransferase family 4 protein [Microbacterium sp. Au-Mic1]|uniref:glycosyltransferase n=1 Tax=Microbacterium sp. Au-Mic1 TaxID=2906457 RepID=UPI001E393CAB|nr:glycosyltransferase family 4 protein [Microbacterium sp. Au-Mic1]MCE4027301.1 glycosyltransferase family 4 protein [Microbacterium sp. Au-Mic1]
MRIVSFSLVVPYPGIPHAGGEYYRRHLGALSTLGHEVTVVAPDTELNRIGLARTQDPGRVILVAGDDSRGLRALDRLAALLLPHWLAPSRRSALRRSPAVREALRHAEFVEAQWEETAFLLRGAAGRRPTALVAHDVPLQRELRWLRSARAQSATTKVVWRGWRALVVAVTQPSSFRSADVVIVLSDKDARQVRRASRRPRVVALDPPLWDPAEHPDPAPGGAALSGGEALSGGAATSGGEAVSGGEAMPVGSAMPGRGPAVFVAAFDRRENVEAAVWLLDEVWPSVCAALPEAALMLVGVHPPESLYHRAALISGVTVTGYVDDLDEVYDTASAALVPLHSGAGVKFKTIDALLRGLPVIATTVGAEGITDDDGRHPFPVTDDPREFAAAVVTALGGASASDSEVTEWARTRYGTDRYARRLVELIPALGVHSPL